MICPEFDRAEITLMDQLRVMRSDIAYRGVMVNPEYLERNRKGLLRVMRKLKSAVRARVDAKR